MKKSEKSLFAFDRGYVSPRVEVVKMCIEGLLCTSGVIDEDKDNEGYFGNDAFEW